MRTFAAWTGIAVAFASAAWVDALRLIHSNFPMFLIWLVAAAALLISAALWSSSPIKTVQENQT